MYKAQVNVVDTMVSEMEKKLLYLQFTSIVQSTSKWCGHNGVRNGKKVAPGAPTYGETGRLKFPTSPDMGRKLPTKKYDLSE